MKRLFSLLLVISVQVSMAQVNITTGSYTQNFGTSNITSWTNNSTFPGWYMGPAGSFQGYANFSNSVNSYNAGGYYSYNCGSDAKIGSRASSGAKPLYYGVVLRNTTGMTIKSIRVNYTGYQMSLAQNGEVNISEFEYLVGTTAPAINASGATSFPALNFTQLKDHGTSGGNQLNWYQCTQSIAISSCIPVTIPNNSYILLRWKDDDDTGNDHHMAIDDVNIAFDMSGGTCLVFLPVELLDFKATRSGKQVVLNWLTASEHNNSLFTIERSTDGLHFESIGSQKGAGNSTTKLSYEAIDTDPLQDISYYRLKQTDQGETYSYSPVVALETDKAFEFKLFPNPNETGQLKVSIPVSGTFKIKLFDSMGQLLYEELTSKELLELDLRNYPKGIYNVQISNGSAVFSKKVLYN